MLTINMVYVFDVHPFNIETSRPFQFFPPIVENLREFHRTDHFGDPRELFAINDRENEEKRGLGALAPFVDIVEKDVVAMGGSP